MTQPYTGYTPPAYPQAIPIESPDAGMDAFQMVISSGLIGLGLAFALLMIVVLLKQFLLISRPNEALVFSGKQSRGPGGEVLPYAIVKQGARGIRIPILHRVDRLDMRLLPVDIRIQNAYSAGNIPLQIHAIATVKIHSDDRVIRNAVERFLGRSLGEIQQVAQQTLEGAVREVVASLTPEEVNEDRLKFAENLIHAAEDDLHKLGLMLDTLKIQNVHDDTGYLDSLGRPRIAAVLRDAENAENEAQEKITSAQAGAHQKAEVARAHAETLTIQKQNELRQVRAELDGAALAIEREAEMAARTARAQAERELYTLRASVEERRLQADVVVPANINREARAILAIGEAAPTAENGRAAVEVLRLLSEAWQSMGPHAKELYVIQHLEELVGTVVANLSDVSVGEVTVLDQGDGSGLAAYASAYPMMVGRVMEALAVSTGVNIPAILNERGAS
ncbi:MAG: flotillin family protein [Myxococcales bacterium]|nr:flotillin family protein [Myxococcales bacterium]MCB9628572.1 flotillin family protein [Sandaracinaceae bacterium]